MKMLPAQRTAIIKAMMRSPVIRQSKAHVTLSRPVPLCCSRSGHGAGLFSADQIYLRTSRRDRPSMLDSVWIVPLYGQLV
jgi:hypothetical protein